MGLRNRDQGSGPGWFRPKIIDMSTQPKGRKARGLVLSSLGRLTQKGKYLGSSGRAFLFFNLFKTDYHLFTQSHVSDKASLADN